MSQLSDHPRLAEYLKRFRAEVKPEHITYDWDGGHCYSLISHPLTHEVSTNLLLTQEEADQWTQTTDEWMYENEARLYCVPNLINELGGRVVADECSDVEGRGEEFLNYVKGFMDLVRNHSDADPAARERWTKWYRFDLLEPWVATMEPLKGGGEQ